MNIIVFDIDDTLLKTKSSVTKVYKDSGKSEVLSTDEYAKDRDIDNPDVDWDFSVFNNPETIYNVMVTGRPLIRNLRVMDHYASLGWRISFLTARSQEDAIYKALLDVIRIKNARGQYEPIADKLSREDSFAVNDKKYDDVFGDLQTPDRKAVVLQQLCDEYDNVIFVDDDKKNIMAARSLHLPNLKTVTAQRESLRISKNFLQISG